MGAENWGLFKLPSDQENDPPRCEHCQLLTCGYVTGVEQLLQLALWLDRQTRFGKSEDASETSAKIRTHTDEVARSWTNYLTHRKTDHAAGLAGRT
jgi:hypothetical protein